MPCLRLTSINTVDVKQLLYLGVGWDIFKLIQLQNLLLHFPAQPHHYLPVMLDCLFEVCVLLPLLLRFDFGN